MSRFQRKFKLQMHAYPVTITYLQNVKVVLDNRRKPQSQHDLTLSYIQRTVHFCKTRRQVSLRMAYNAVSPVPGKLPEFA